MQKAGMPAAFHPDMQQHVHCMSGSARACSGGSRENRKNEKKSSKTKKPRTRLLLVLSC
jgi:hypothetical protein